jgi:hypothetical protein
METAIMLYGIMSIVYSILSNKFNPHLVYGRGRAGILIAFGWSLWTYSVIYADYNFFFNLGRMLESNTLYNLIIIEVANIGITILTALHLLGHQFKWLKRTK